MNTTTTAAKLAAIAAAATLDLSGCAQTLGAGNAPAPGISQEAAAQPAPTKPSGAPTAAAAASAAALAVLPSIPAKGRAPKTGYKHELSGPAWKDIDRDGCDTRNQTLKRDLTAVKLKPGTRDCVVLSGHLADPYTGVGVDFVRGGASEVDIDHLVPLSDAFQKGAQDWDQDKRERLANDPANLAASAASANRSKGDSDLVTAQPRPLVHLHRSDRPGQSQLRALDDTGRTRTRRANPHRLHPVRVSKAMKAARDLMRQVAKEAR